MSQIAGLQNFRQQGPPADIGTFQLPYSVLFFQHTFSGTTYVCALRSGERGWILVDYGTDASTVINTALALGLTDYFLCGGKYYITATLIINDYQRLEGAGQDKTYLQLAANVDLIRNQDYNVSTNQHIYIAHMTLEGDRANYTGSGIAGNFVRSTFEHLRVEHFVTYAVNLFGVDGDNAADNYFLGCYFYECTLGGFVQGPYAPDNRFQNCVFGNNGGNQYELGAWSVNTVIIGCHFYSSGQTGAEAYGIYFNQTGQTIGLRIIGCEFSNIDRSAISLRSTTGAVYDVLIIGNMFVDIGKATDNTYPVIDLYQIADAKIVANSIVSSEDNKPNYGIYTEHLYDCTIADNDVKDCATAGILINQATDCATIGNTVHLCGGGIQIQNSTDITCSSNNIHDNVGHGIDFWSSSWCTVVGNSLVDNDSGDTASFDGIYLAGESDNNTINDNVGHGNDRYQINIANATCDNNVCMGNRLDATGAVGHLNDAGTGTLKQTAAADPYNLLT